jgi:hypothetical protein
MNNSSLTLSKDGWPIKVKFKEEFHPSVRSRCGSLETRLQKNTAVRTSYALTVCNEVQCSGESSFIYLAKQVIDHALIRAILSRGASGKGLTAL